MVLIHTRKERTGTKLKGMTDDFVKSIFVFLTELGSVVGQKGGSDADRHFSVSCFEHFRSHQHEKNADCMQESRDSV
jgi:hypothetical protein